MAENDTYTDRIKTAWAVIRGRGPAPTSQPAKAMPAPRVAASAPMGQRGRISTDTPGNPLNAFGLATAARADRGRDWRSRNLDAKTLDKIPTSELIELLADLSPEISSALWHFVRFCNPGYEINAYKPGTTEPDEKAEALLSELLKRISSQHGAANVAFNQFFMTAFVRGAMLGEVILDDRRQPAGLVAVDPMVAEYKEARDQILGQVWLLGQKDDKGKFMPLNYPTIRYVPIDPLPGAAPYGRPLVTPAIFVALFLIAMLHDLRRVVAQQGYPRIDIEIVMENLRASMPEDQQQNLAAIRAWLSDAVTEITDVYTNLQPDEAFIHTDVAKIAGPVGAVNTQGMAAFVALIEALERMIVRGLKALPLALGHHDGSTETYANRAWEIHTATIKSVQQLAETMLQDLFTVALEAQGVVATVEVKFAELRASEMLRDEQTRAMQIGNAAAMYDRGWISQDEAAMLVTGEAADNWRPRFVSLQGSLDIVDLAVSGQDEIAALQAQEDNSEDRAQTRRQITRGQLIGEIRQAMAQLDRYAEAAALATAHGGDHGH